MCLVEVSGPGIIKIVFISEIRTLQIMPVKQSFSKGVDKEIKVKVGKIVQNVYFEAS